jgi:hypothetical protein
MIQDSITLKELLGILEILFFISLPFIGGMQVLVAIFLTATRIPKKRGMKGWIIYWKLTFICLMYVWICYNPSDFWRYDLLICLVPAIWFFFADPYSDKKIKQMKVLDDKNAATINHSTSQANA